MTGNRPLRLWVVDLARDLRYASRRLRRAPGTAFVALVTLGLGIGATVAVFSAVNSVLLQPFPIPGLPRMVSVARTEDGRVQLDRGLTGTLYQSLELQRLTTIEGLTRVRFLRTVLSTAGGTEVVLGEAVGGWYFSICGVGPQLGRVLQPSDTASLNSPAVISDRLWRRMFGARSGVIGEGIHLAGVVRTIVGVAPRGFAGTLSPHLLGSDVWVLLPDDSTTPSEADRPSGVFARLRRGVTTGQAAAEINVVGHRLEAGGSQLGLAIVPAAEAMTPTPLQRVLVTGGVVAVALSMLVLLIACSNLASLSLASVVQRQGEVALRLATGASSARITQLLVVESSLLALLGGAVAWGLVIVMTRLAGTIELPHVAGVPLSHNIAPDWRVAAFAVAATAGTALAVGILPARHACAIDPQPALANGGNSLVATGPRVNQQRLLSVQVGAAVMVLLLAALFLRTVWGLSRVDPGFDRTHTALGHFDFAMQGLDEAQGQRAFARAVEAVGQAPGVERAAVATGLPWDHDGFNSPLKTERDPLGGASRLYGRVLAVSADYLDVLGVRILRGRGFRPEDDQSQRRVAIITESVASGLWPGEDPLGRSLCWRNRHADRDEWEPPAEVVGVVGDLDRTSSERVFSRTIFAPLHQNYVPRGIVVVRGHSDGRVLVEPLRATLHQRAPDLAAFDIRSMNDQIELPAVPARFAAVVLSVLGSFGLFIALVGLYGLTTYVVKMRQREVGVRRALGATDAHVYQLLLHDGLRVLVTGLGPGVLAAFGLALVVRHTLYGVAPYDPLTFITVPAAVLVVGLLAWALAARRAVRVEPSVALRNL